MVIGTTGFSPEERQQLEAAAQEIPIVFRRQLQRGRQPVPETAGYRGASAGRRDVDIEVIEAHHRIRSTRRPAPRPAHGEVVANALGVIWKRSPVYGRGSETLRERETIGLPRCVAMWW